MLYNYTIQQDTIVQHITTINPSPTQLNNTLLYNTIQQDIRMQHNKKNTIIQKNTTGNAIKH